MRTMLSHPNDRNPNLSADLSQSSLAGRVPDAPFLYPESGLKTSILYGFEKGFEHGYDPEIAKAEQKAACRSSNFGDVCHDRDLDPSHTPHRERC